MSTLNIAGTTSQKGVASPYQAAAKAGVTTTGIHGYDSGNISVSGGPGKPTIKQVDATIQDSTDPLVVGQVAVADNFLASTASQPGGNAAPQGKQGVPAANAAQAASTAKSLAPQHE